MGDFYCLFFAFLYFLNSHKWQEAVSTHSFEEVIRKMRKGLSDWIYMEIYKSERERSSEIIKDADSVGAQMANC